MTVHSATDLSLCFIALFICFERSAQREHAPAPLAVERKRGLARARAAGGDFARTHGFDRYSAKLIERSAQSTDGGLILTLRAALTVMVRCLAWLDVWRLI